MCVFRLPENILSGFLLHWAVNLHKRLLPTLRGGSGDRPAVYVCQDGSTSVSSPVHLPQVRKYQVNTIHPVRFGNNLMDGWTSGTTLLSCCDWDFTAVESRVQLKVYTSVFPRFVHISYASRAKNERKRKLRLSTNVIFPPFSGYLPTIAFLWF